jgi:hypothetical protein
MGWPASTASAHGTDPAIDDSVGGMVPQQPGVTFAIVDSVVPELSATNTTGQPLDVLDRFGDAYLRIGPAGAQGNLNSAQFYRSADPSDTAQVPAGVAHIGVAPKWVTLSADPAWAWFDPRVRTDIDTAPADVVNAHRRATLAAWSIPLHYRGDPARLDGQVVYDPPVGGAAARLTSGLHPDPAITAALEPGQYPDLFVANSGTTPLTVFGQAGEPFARIDSTGASVNLSSPVHAADAIARGQTPEAPPNASAPPRWQHVSDQSSYDWLDPRTRYLGSTPSTAVLTDPRPTVLQRWSIPASLGPRPLTLDGVIDWIPAPDARVTLAAEGIFAPAARTGRHGSAGWWLGGAAAVVVLVGMGTVGFRRRKRLNSSR